MDTDVAVWILDFILRQPFIDDRTLTSLITSLPLPSDSLNLSKALLIRRIQSEVEKGSVSENILDLLELVEELDHVTGVPATEAIKRAYCLVAVDCTVRALKDAAEYFEMVKRVWRDRVGQMGDCGLVSDELFGWRDLVEAAVLDLGACESLKVRWRENDTMGAVRAYVVEAWEGLGLSFLEVVGRTVASDAAVREVLGVTSGIFEIREENIVSEGDNATTNNDTREMLPSADNQGLRQDLITDNVINVVSQKGTILPRRKHVAVKRTRGSVAGTSRGAKITDTEQVDDQDLSSRYGGLPSPAISKVQEALRASSFELQAVVKDPLPEALQFAENVISSKNTDSRNPEVQENDADRNKPCTNQQNNAPKPSLMTRNCTARTYEWDDSIDSLPGVGADSRSTIKLPSPKNIVVSPLKKHEMNSLTGRRKPKKWSMLEEETLRTGVQKYGKGCWKAILNSYRDIFEDRTYVDLKDKWRIMTRYTN